MLHDERHAMMRSAKAFRLRAAPTLWVIMAALLFCPAPNRAVAAEETGKPIAVVEGRAPGARTEILSLKRSEGGMLTLRYALVNASGDSIPLNYFAGCCGSAATTLIDYVNRKKYLIITDSTGECLCTAIANSFSDIDAPRRVLYAKFPAPPESVSHIAVLFTGAEPVDEVPISR
jgi:hypothetical protein